MLERKTGNRGGWTGSRASRGLGWGAVGLLLVALGLVSIDSIRARARNVAAGDAELRRTARVAEALWEADAARIQALLARLRVELRTGTRWAEVAAERTGGTGSVPTRRTDTLLRRAFEGMPELDALELVVADQSGLASVRVEPGAGPPLDGATEREARARALWYADDVAEAIEANGRRVARGPIEIEREGETGRARMRAVIALHDAGEVVQGVLVATIDLWPLGTRLATLSSDSIRLALATSEGQPIGRSPVVDSGGAVVGEASGDHPVPEGHADAGADPSLAPIVEVGEVRRLVQPVREGASGKRGTVHFRVETDRPASIAATLFGGPGSVLLGAVVALAAALATSGPAQPFARRPAESTSVDEQTQAVASEPMTTPSAAFGSAGSALRAVRVDTAANEPEAPRARAASAEHEVGGTTVAPIQTERFVLREWLADVRGCLEREAASRGLSLVLRCERSLPREVAQDPLWLGGLIVSLGREALDATRGARVALEVSHGEGAALRFELDAGDGQLDPVEGMRVLARQLGATFESSRPGRLAVVLPHALA